MIFDNPKLINNRSYPVVIVGSGPAGITLAKKLEEKKIHSLIIEAGKLEYDDNSQANYDYKGFGDSITDLKYSRLRQFGGTSGHWGGWCKPIEEWNIKKWGLNYEEIKNYQKEACEILNVKNEFNNANIDDYFNQIQFQYSNLRFAEKYKNFISKSQYIDLVYNTQVTKFNGEEKKIKNVEIIQNKKKYFIKSYFFILCGGGIENSRILLWTKETNKQLVNNDLPIGNYWMTHPWIIGGVGFLYKSKLSNLLNNKYLNYDGPVHLATREKITMDNNILSGALYMNAKEDEKIYKEIIKDFLCVAPSYGKKIARSIFRKDLKCGNIFMNLEEAPVFSNKILLDKKLKDINEIPLTNLYYKKSEKTLNSIKSIMQELGKTFINFNLGRVAINPEIIESNSYENLGVHHHLGGTRIGFNKKKSVVDVNLKVHDLNNLYISGSSVFTTASYENPTFTIVQLSIRLANKISYELIKK